MVTKTKANEIKQKFPMFRETKNAFRYDCTGEDPIPFGAVYISREWMKNMGVTAPEDVEVTINF